MKLTRTGALVACTLTALAQEPAPKAAKADPSMIRIESRDGLGEVELSPDARTASAKNGVVVRWKGSTVSAQTVHLDQEKGEALAEGDVVVEYASDCGERIRWKGQQVRFDFLQKKVDAGQFRFGAGPLFLKGDRVSVTQGGTNQVVLGGEVTTDDVAEPGYRIRARSLSIDGQRTISAEDALLYVGKVPVMYFPWYVRKADRHPNFFTVTPGYRSLYGPYVLGSYHWMSRTNLETVVDLDYRQRRGIGGGPRLSYDLGDLGKGRGGFYYLRDQAPELSAFNGPIDPDRYRLDLRHSITNDSGFEFKGILRGQSDPMVLRDYFEREFRTDPQPKTLVEFSRLGSNWSLDFLTHVQVNEFFRTVERLPDVRLRGLRQQIGVTPVYYESDSSLAYLRYRDALAGGTNYAAFRGDSYHQLVAPHTFGGWLNVSPRLGARATYYGDPEGLNAIPDDRHRWVANTGVDVGFKASRLWPQFSSTALDMNGARHIAEPQFSYVFVPEPNRTPMELPKFDRELITPKLLPIHFPDYTQIDSVDSQNTVRLGLRNKLQTKREGQVENVLNWSLLTDWRLQQRSDQTRFSDVYSEMDFTPRSWLTLTSETRFDTLTHEFRESNHRATWTANEWCDWSIGHRYLRDDWALYGAGNNLIFSRFHAKLNENWAVRGVHQFEARDGTLEEQQYQVYRDLRSWTVGLGVRLRENRIGPQDWTIAVTFSLKAFPRFLLGEDRSNPSMLLGM
ncbi:MAG: LPS-assembly protein LptD [Verrucomicrobiota bacterium]